MCPFAYGGPSCKINFSFPADFFLSLLKILSFSHFSKICGSLKGKLAFIEKAVLGSCKVSLDMFYLAKVISIFICFFKSSRFLNFFSGLINFLKLIHMSLLYRFLLIPNIFVSNNKLWPLNVGL